MRISLNLKQTLVIVLLYFTVVSLVIYDKYCTQIYTLKTNLSSRVTAIEEVLSFGTFSSYELWHMLGFLKNEYIVYFSISNNHEEVLINYGDKSNSVNNFLILKDELIIKNKGRIEFKINYYLNKKSILISIIKNDIVYILFVTILMLLVLLLKPLFDYARKKRDQEIIDFLVFSSDEDLIKFSEKKERIGKLGLKILQLIEEKKEKAKEYEVTKILSIQAKQVAHDIRSPLSALNIITSTLTDVPEEKRLLIRNSVQRINDIANDLLQKGKSNLSILPTSGADSLNYKSENADVTVDNKNQPLMKKNNMQNFIFLVSTVVDNIVSEKRIQFREKINVNINVDLKNSFGLFISANPNELSRVISNLINNSVEALPNQSGGVDILVFENIENKICIQIKDNGRGIPKHVLAKLGQSGVTHGKENTQSGSGLGVYHAMKTIRDFGGSIHFESITEEEIDPNTQSKTTGTVITVELPKAETPTWFAESIQLKPGQHIVTVDDDISIHQIWKGRLESLKVKEQNIKITSFTSAKEFRDYFNKDLKPVFNKSCIHSVDIKSEICSKPNSTVVFLIDFEFLNQNDNGLKIITDLGIQDKAILVTSRFDEPNIRSECEVQKIKILPKQLAGQIGISIMPNFDHSTNEIASFENTNLSKTELTINNQSCPMELYKYDLCLIDDDKLLVHSIWKMVAKEKGLNIKMFERPEDFLSQAQQIDKTTPIFVDVSLENNVNGIEVANRIHELGFENINLATGYDSETLKVPGFIRQVVGKDFPI